jgi:NADH-quinone oxidoreductase subunit C
MDATATLDVLTRALPAGRVEPLTSGDEMPGILVDASHIVDVCHVLRNHADLQFAFLADITAVDFAPADPRFEVIYHLACLGEHYVVPEAGSRPAVARRLRVKVRLPDGDPSVPSVTPVWPAANWLEREVFDLFGISFIGHPDLRRVLMPDDWVGYPLRKDYPVQIRKDTASWSPLELSAEEFAANIRERQGLAHKQAAPRTDRE